MFATEQIANPLNSVTPTLEYGEIKPRETANALRSKLIIASYNIRYAVGRSLISTGILRKAGLNLPRQRAERVAKNIFNAARALSDGRFLPAVDLLAVQEADKQTVRAGGHHVARELAEELKMSWVHAPAGIPRGQPPKPRQWWLDFEEQIGIHEPGDTGIALLSHLPLEEVVRIDLPWKECAWRPHLSIGATIRFGSQTIRILNSHLDPHSSANGQIEQLAVVIAQAEQFSGPAVVLGDFNTLSTKKCLETRRLLESHGFVTPFPTGTATWHGAGIRLHADWIFVRNLDIKRWGVARPLNVSDHWPIWAELDLAE